MKRLFWALAALVALLVPAPLLAQSLNPTATAASTCSSELACLRTILRPSTAWSYVAATGGITDTNAVTIKAAAGAGKRNYIKSCQFANSGAAGTAIRLVNGAAGTVIWRGYIGAAVSNQNIIFEVPLMSSANTLLEVSMVSGTTIAVYVNCQGYTD
jgi:hypothetical protein